MTITIVMRRKKHGAMVSITGIQKQDSLNTTQSTRAGRCQRHLSMKCIRANTTLTQLLLVEKQSTLCSTHPKHLQLGIPSNLSNHSRQNISIHSEIPSQSSSLLLSLSQLKGSLSQNIDLTIVEKNKHLTLIVDHSSHGQSQKRRLKRDLLNRKLRDHSVRSRDHNGNSSNSPSIVNSVNSSNQLLFAHKISGKIKEVSNMDKVLRNLSSLSKKDHNRKEKDLLNNSTNRIQPTLQAAIHMLQ